MRQETQGWRTAPRRWCPGSCSAWAARAGGAAGAVASAAAAPVARPRGCGAAGRPTAAAGGARPTRHPWRNEKRLALPQEAAGETYGMDLCQSTNAFCDG